MRLITLWAIRVYQRTWTRRTPQCWQTPSCSQYGYEAVRAHGFRAGIIMAAERIQTCTAENRETSEGREHVHSPGPGYRADRDDA